MNFFTRSPRTSLNSHSCQANIILAGVHREILLERNLGVKVQAKVKFTQKQVTRAQRWIILQLHSFFNLDARRGGWSTPRPTALPLGKTRYSSYRRLGGYQGRSEQVRKISPPPEFDPWAVQHVASHYTDWAITARNFGVFS